MGEVGVVMIIAGAGSGATWWQVALITIGGVLITQIVTLKLGYKAFARQDKSKWDKEKLEAYGRLNLAVDALGDLPEVRNPNAMRDVRLAYQAVRLIGSKDVAEAARTCIMHAAPLILDHKTMDLAFYRHATAMSNAMSKELGGAASELPPDQVTPT